MNNVKEFLEGCTDTQNIKKELLAIAAALKANNVPQETINMILAVRLGLPVQPLDLRSPCFKWIEE